MVKPSSGAVGCLGGSRTRICALRKATPPDPLDHEADRWYRDSRTDALCLYIPEGTGGHGPRTTPLGEPLPSSGSRRPTRPLLDRPTVRSEARNRLINGLNS